MRLLDRADRDPPERPGRRPGQALRDSLELALAIGRPLSLLAAIAIFTDLLAAQGERRAAARLLRFAMSHPAMTVQGRHQLQPRLDALADADPGDADPPWPGPPLDELARRIVAETPAGTPPSPPRCAPAADASPAAAGPFLRSARVLVPPCRAWNAHATHLFAQCGPRQQEPPCKRFTPCAFRPRPPPAPWPA